MDAFRAHGVVEAFGFVNANKLASNADGGAALDAWRSAGHPLGNHTFSHMNIARAATLGVWQADVEAGEPAVAERMQGHDWHWLRFPFLSVGDQPDAAMAYLKGRGYRVADVSLTFSDWAYTDAYARCAAKGDSAAIAAMKAQYLDAVDDGIARMKEDSKRIYGRIIPQVLLTHAGGWSAITLPEVLARLDAAGAHYVTLAQAQSDPAYADPGGGEMMQRTAGKLKIELTPAIQPRVKLRPETLCH
jgi:peptidoglycan/xylan/chitin deacetylase (PgdA/CDA1 family)